MGIALYVERVGPGWESAAVRLDEDGGAVVHTGSSPHGQGHETTFAQIAADELGIDPADVEVRWGDSFAIPEGVGTFASRSVTVGGSAILLACRELRWRCDRTRGTSPSVSGAGGCRCPCRRRNSSGCWGHRPVVVGWGIRLRFRRPSNFPVTA